MAEGKYLYQIPYGVTKEIVMSMDADKSWENLAAEIGYTFDNIQQWQLEYHKYCGSPTKALLWDWGSRNATVKDLYNKLNVIHREREMKILENYVASAKENTKHQAEKLINGEKRDLVSLPSSNLPISDMDNLPLPKLPSSKCRPTEGDTDTDEVNFNQPKGPVTKSKVSSKVLPDSSEKEKQYDNKKIPGTMSVSKTSDVKNSACYSSRISPCPQESVSTVTTDSSKATESTDSSSFDFSSLEKSDPMKGFETLKSYMKSDSLKFDDAVALMGTPNFEYKELSEATDGFSTRHKVGTGAFGTVFYGTLRCSKCAIKKLESENKGVKNDNTSQLRSELSALLRYRHENIVNLYGYALDGPALCLVYQYMVNGSLEDRLQCKDNTSPLSWERRFIIASGAAKGLQFLHNFGSKALIHGDIKSANILLDKHFEAKIGDLGQAQHANSGALTGKFTHITQKNTSSKFYGTRAYLAPELNRGGGNVSVKSDVFAFGVVLLELCSGEKPFDDRREGDKKFLFDFFLELKDEAQEDDNKLCRILRDKRAGECPETFVINLITTASKCLQEKKKDRITSEKLLYQLDSIEESMKELLGPSSSEISSFSGSVHYDPLSHSSGGYSAPNLAQNPGRNPGPLSQESIHRQQPQSQIPGSKLKDSTPPSPVELFEGKEFSTLPEALKLQMIVDARKEGKPLDPISLYKAMNKQEQEKEKPEEYPSDPEKMRQIQNCTSKFAHDCDPAKLKALKMFDTENPMVREPDESSENDRMNPGDYIPASDPAKLRKLENFDRQISDGSLPSGLLFGDQQSPQPYVPGSPCIVNGIQGLNISQGQSQFVSPGVNNVRANPQQSILYERHQGQGQNCSVQYQAVQKDLEQRQYPEEQMRQESEVQLHSPCNSMSSSGGSYFSSGSQPTIVRADLSGQASPGAGFSYGSPVSNVVQSVFEVCEESTPMAKQKLQEERSFSVPHQKTDTKMSGNVNFTSADAKSHSMPEQTPRVEGQTVEVTDLRQMRNNPEERVVQYRTNKPSTKSPVEYRESVGFPYTGLTVHDQNGHSTDHNLNVYGQGQISTQGQGDSPLQQCHGLPSHESNMNQDRLSEGEGQSSEGQTGQGHLVEGQVVCESSNRAQPQASEKTNLFDMFDDFDEAIANAEYEEDGEDENEGEEAEKNDDNSITDINV